MEFFTREAQTTLIHWSWLNTQIQNICLGMSMIENQQHDIVFYYPKELLEAE